MILKNPEECRQFLDFAIKTEKEKLWCITMDGEGQILCLIETEEEYEKALTQIQRHLWLHRSLPGAEQSLFVVTGRKFCLLLPRDELIIDSTRRILKSIQQHFCDFLILTENNFFSLLDVNILV